MYYSNFNATAQMNVFKRKRFLMNKEKLYKLWRCNANLDDAKSHQFYGKHVIGIDRYRFYFILLKLTAGSDISISISHLILNT